MLRRAFEQELYISLAARLLRMINWRMNRLYQFIFKNIPHNHSGDNLFILLKFIETHSRLPKDQFLLNDYIYHNKINNELSNPLRVFVTDK
jgi:hypothetical protein